MTMSDLTIEILKQIRDAAYETNARLDRTRTEILGKLDETNSRIDQTNIRLDLTRTEFLEKLDQTRGELSEKIDGTNARLDRLEGSVSELVGHVVAIADRGGRLADDVADLRRRIEALEKPRH
jgi:chromosome segregation ATPase